MVTPEQAQPYEPVFTELVEIKPDPWPRIGVVLSFMNWLILLYLVIRG